MKTSLSANGNYIILRKEEPEMDDMKRALLLGPDELNPSILYGKVLDSGPECVFDYSDGLVYVNKLSAIKLNHVGEEYYIVNEKDIFVIVSEDE